MPNKSLQELKDEFKRDYSSAVSFYNVNDIIHFYRDIRPSIENFGKLILFDIVGEQTFHNIEDNNEFVNESGICDLNDLIILSKELAGFVMQNMPSRKSRISMQEIICIQI